MTTYNLIINKFAENDIDVIEAVKSICDLKIGTRMTQI